MEAVIIELSPLPGKFTELAVLVKQMVKEVRDYPGCLQAEALFAPDRDEIAVFERWESADAFSEYLIWRSKQEQLEHVFKLTSQEPGLSSFTLCETG